MPTRAVIDNDTGRKADLAAIHMGKAKLGWSDDEYRDILWTICQVRSSALLDIAGRKKFLAHLRACGFQGYTSARDKTRSKTAKPWTPELRKIWSLWQQLADAGQVQQRDRAGLIAWVARLTGVDRLEWLNTHQTALVIEAAKKWLQRAEDEAEADTLAQQQEGA
jgi:hypothetical protein